MTFRSVTKDEGVRAAAEVARQLGLRFACPVVLHDRSNLLVHLSPAPVVARIATATATMRPGKAWMAREVAVAGYLAGPAHRSWVRAERSTLVHIAVRAWS